MISSATWISGETKRSCLKLASNPSKSLKSGKLPSFPKKSSDDRMAADLTQSKIITVKYSEMEKEKEIFFDHLRRSGLKRTTQRELILDVFLETEGHSSAEELHQLIRSRDPHVGVTTVYRTLKLLSECGLAREERLGDGRTRYEHLYNHQHHDHLICTNCGKLIEFYSEVIESKQDEIAELYHFQPTHHSLRIFGVCDECQVRKQASMN